MLTRLYIDNFRSFQNFEYFPESKQLLLGANGSGKTSLLEVIRRLKSFVKGGSNLFTQSTRTRWRDSSVQLFELEARLSSRKFEYRLELGYAGVTREQEVVLERLIVNGRTALIVLIDADDLPVHERLAQLDRSPDETQADRVRPDAEQIARLVPKRNIETWILCLNDVLVDEESDYKRTRSDWATLIRLGIETLYDWTRPNSPLPAGSISSLRLGVAELKGSISGVASRRTNITLQAAKNTILAMRRKSMKADEGALAALAPG